jgi:hypothetical protein
MLSEGLKNFSSSWIYAAVWHAELLCSSRHSRPQNHVSRDGVVEDVESGIAGKTLQQVNSAMIAIRRSSINYIFLVSEAQ